MRPTVVSVTGVGNSAPVPLNWRRKTFGVSLAAVVSGAATYTVQHSFDDPEAAYATDYNTNATWFDHEQLAGMTANADGNYAFPVRATRVRITSGSGTVTLTVIQAGG